MRLDNANTQDRVVTAVFDEGEFTVLEKRPLHKAEIITLSAEEIEKLHDFKMEMTGERS